METEKIEQPKKPEDKLIELKNRREKAIFMARENPTGFPIAQIDVFFKLSEHINLQESLQLLIDLAPTTTDPNKISEHYSYVNHFLKTQRFAMNEEIINFVLSGEQRFLLNYVPTVIHIESYRKELKIFLTKYFNLWKKQNNVEKKEAKKNE